MSKLFFVGLLTIFLAGCASALYQPLPEHATASVSYEQLVQGRAVYVNKCGSCHSLYLPHQYTAEVWAHNLDEMQERSKMSDEEKKMVYDYIISAPVAADSVKK